MIIQCESCSRKFVVNDRDIPETGRMVQCGYCSVTWHQMPVTVSTQTFKQTNIIRPVREINEALSVDGIKASDGKTYKFLGTQWAELLPSGKTGLFARKKIGKELDRLTGRKKESSVEKKRKKIKKEVDPSSGSLNNEKQLPDIYKPKRGLGFFGYIFLLIIVGFSVTGVLKTFENDLLSNYPQTEYIFKLLNKQLEYVSETVKNMIVIINDLIDSY
jgi:predicted Zn finger-like uncharacterized protein